MAAIVRSHHHIPAPVARPARPARPHLVVLEGGRSARRQQARYRRRRVLVAVVVLVLGWVALQVVGAVVDAVRPVPASTAPSVVAPAGSPTAVVQPGDTLWSIARRLQPQGDVRPLVDRLVALNGAAPLVPGGRVVVPA